jgi:SagB-type dehydrogenase family enzyme
MKRRVLWLAACLAATALAGGATAEIVDLPGPRTDGDLSVERALQLRRTVRAFRRAPLTLAQAAQLLWAAQGITRVDGRRTAPSAGALYPLQLYLVAGNVTGLAPGIYRYEPAAHRLRRVVAGERRADLAHAALGQSWIAAAPAILAFGAIESRTTRKYGGRGVAYVYIEVGHAAQNVLLQAQALGLGAAVVGAFDDGRVTGVLGMSGKERPLYLIPVGEMQD